MQKLFLQQTFQLPEVHEGVLKILDDTILASSNFSRRRVYDVKREEAYLATAVKLRSEDIQHIIPLKQ